MIILENLENICLENINTNNNCREKFLQICINTLDQMAPRICHFLIEN